MTTRSPVETAPSSVALPGCLHDTSGPNPLLAFESEAEASSPRRTQPPPRRVPPIRPESAGVVLVTLLLGTALAGAFYRRHPASPPTSPHAAVPAATAQTGRASIASEPAGLEV